MQNRPLLRDLLQNVYVPGFLMFAGYGMTMPVIPLYATSLGATLTLAGVVVSVRGAGQLLLNLPSGMLLERIGNRPLLLISTIGALITAVGIGLSRSMLPLILWTFLTGGIQSAWSMTRVSYIRSTVPPAHRGRAISALGGLIRIGGFLGPIAGGYIAKGFGYASTFYLQAAIIGVALILYLTGSRRTANPAAIDPPRAAPAKHPRGRVFRILKTHARDFLSVGLVTVAFSVIRSARQTVFPLWGDAIALDVAQIGLVVGISSGIDMLLFPAAGHIMDRYGRKWTATPSLLIMALALLILPGAGSFGLLLTVGIIIGFGNGLGAGIVMTLGTDLAPEEDTGTFLGVWFLVAGIGGTIGPLLIGIIADIASLATASIITAAVGLAGGLFLLFCVPETGPGRLPPGSRR